MHCWAAHKSSFLVASHLHVFDNIVATERSLAMFSTEFHAIVLSNDMGHIVRDLLRETILNVSYICQLYMSRPVLLSSLQTIQMAQYSCYVEQFDTKVSMS